MTNKFYAIYTRVSTEEQANAKENSLISQEQRCREALRYKYPNQQLAIRIFSDTMSGATDRPEYQQLIAAIKTDQVAAVRVRSCRG